MNRKYYVEPEKCEHPKPAMFMRGNACASWCQLCGSFRIGEDYDWIAPGEFSAEPGEKNEQENRRPSENNHNLNSGR